MTYPQHLYRYREYSELNLRMLAEEKLYFSSPGTFNDPFDCNISIDCESDENEYIEAVIQTCSRRTDRSEKPVDLLQRDLNADGSLKPRVRERALEAMDQLRQDLNSYGVCCFSEKGDLLLLWSHYADNYRGFCLEFENMENCFVVNPVSYRPEYPSVRVVDLLMEGGTDRFNELILTKFEDWSYEREWRAFSQSPGEMPYPNNTLTGIIFGFRMEKPERDSIRHVLRYRQNIVYKEVQPSSNRFALEIVDI